MNGISWAQPYGLALAAGCLAAWWLARRRARQVGIEASHIDLALPVIYTAIVLVAALLAAIGTGRSTLAAVLTGLPVLYAYARAARLPFRWLTDAVALPALVLMACVRVGCLLAGCCFGKPSGWQALPLHPVQLYEAALLILLVLSILRARAMFRQPGAEALFALGGYAMLRFALQFLRGDGAHATWWLDSQQLAWLAGLVIIAAIALLAPRKASQRGKLRN